MTSEEPVQPLRLSKSSTMPMPSPAKALPRALSEISPTEKRRNSPSWNQTTKKMALTDSSPFQSSPMENTTSPRMFWQNRNTENSFGRTRSGSPTPCRRTSIERLQKASRVKNSNILALEQKQEYDPTRVPHVERPLAKVQGNAFGGSGAAGLRTENRPLGHHRSESKTSIPSLSPSKTAFPQSATSPVRPVTPSKDQPSPSKSSLSSSRFKSSFDPETGTWTEVSGDERSLPEGRSLHRHQKSVTFDAAPPQVNEYEMATPDLSSIGSNSREGSYESESEEDDDDHYMIHGSADPDDSFDASLEDTDKTPVVGPDDWRQGSHDDPFEKSPMPEDLPPIRKSLHHRTDSSNSNAESRPLPPLPGLGQAGRSLPSPPAASDDKSETHNIGNGRMPLEERLRLMMLSGDGKSAAEQQRERRMRRAGPRERAESQTPERESRSPSVQPPSDYEEEDTIGEISGLEEYQLPPRISRESILRRVNGNKPFERESDYHFSSPPGPSSPERVPQYDPDVPIPSTEDSLTEDDEEDGDSDDVSDDGSVIIKRDVEGRDFDVYSIPDMYQHSETLEEDELDDDKRPSDDDSASQYSEEEEAHDEKARASEEDQVPTPRAFTPVDEPVAVVQEDDAPASFKLSGRLGESDFSNSFDSCMLAKPEEPKIAAEPEKLSMSDDQARPFTPEQQLTRSLTKPEYDGSGWGEPEEAYDEPGTPDSVIHHPIFPTREEEAARHSPAIPEQLATIKSASGSKLKTRPSATPSDLAAMREARRQVSREVPPIPERSRSRLSRDMSAGIGEESGDFLERHPSFKNRSLTLDLDLGLSLDQDFDRVIEAQKVAFHQVLSVQPSATAASLFQAEHGAARPSIPLSATVDNLSTNISQRKQRGYLMRQNTKVVTASDKDMDDLRACRSAGNSPVKAARPQSWTVEPWSGGQRKRSIRKRHPVTGPVPPLPGQESNAAALGQVNEEDMAVEMATEESGERGRLFVKVMGVKDLDLPIPKNERTWFSLTLDNGVHCVTTAWLEMARNAPIGQEFELVVPNDLEFQLTLNVKLEKPAPAPISKKALPSPTKTNKPKTSTFSRVFASPKKRREMEQRQKQQEEEERLTAQREAQARQTMIKSSQQPTAWDLLSPLAAEDGSFARAYVCLKEHEPRCFGRPYLVDVAAFNEWATEEAGFASSVKSKRSNAPGMGAGVIRRAPYKIGKLELQLLFVPRPKGSVDDDMPKSMNSCIREMKAAEERLARSWEGHLSQQGGDCPYWRRRYFKLVGAKLTAYHEATRQPRATINLANAKRLIDDRRTLMEKETTGKGGRRRRSAFAEEEEGYMFVEEGFRIRFNNGELIDFYADSTEDKEGWMRVLAEVIGRDSIGSVDAAGTGEDLAGGSRMKGKWCELVLKKEEALKKRAEGRRVHSRTKSMYL